MSTVRQRETKREPKRPGSGVPKRESEGKSEKREKPLKIQYSTQVGIVAVHGERKESKKGEIEYSLQEKLAMKKLELQGVTDIIVIPINRHGGAPELRRAINLLKNQIRLRNARLRLFKEPLISTARLVTEVNVAFSTLNKITLAAFIKALLEENINHHIFDDIPGTGNTNPNHAETITIEERRLGVTHSAEKTGSVIERMKNLNLIHYTKVAKKLILEDEARLLAEMKRTAVPVPPVVDPLVKIDLGFGRASFPGVTPPVKIKIELCETKAPVHTGTRRNSKDGGTYKDRRPSRVLTSGELKDIFSSEELQELKRGTTAQVTDLLTGKTPASSTPDTAASPDTASSISSPQTAGRTPSSATDNPLTPVTPVPLPGGAPQSSPGAGAKPSGGAGVDQPTDTREGTELTTRVVMGRTVSSA